MNRAITITIDKRVHRLLGFGGVYADVFEIVDNAYKLFEVALRFRRIRRGMGAQGFFKGKLKRISVFNVIRGLLFTLQGSTAAVA